jgi:hypothetical protein
LNKGIARKSEDDETNLKSILEGETKELDSWVWWYTPVIPALDR